VLMAFVVESPWPTVSASERLLDLKILGSFDYSDSLTGFAGDSQPLTLYHLGRARDPRSRG